MNAITPGSEGELDTIRAELKARAEDVARELLGEPNRKLSNRRELRWGRKGSQSLARSGAKRGLFRDHDANEGGDLLWLIRRRETGDDFPAAVAWARGFLGMPELLSRPDTNAKRAEREAQRKAQAEKRAQDQARQEAEQAGDGERRIAAARQWVQESVPADGTPADTYLTKWRRIPRPASGWPNAVRYHQRQNALVLPLTTEAGEVQAVQIILLTSDARKLPQEEAAARGFPATKFTRGLMAGAVVRLPVRLPGTDETLLVAEGPETALSVWAATGKATWATCGSTDRIAPPHSTTAILCADDDPHGPRKSDKVRKTSRAWREAGVRCHVARPWAVRRFNKSDFNDTLREEGEIAVATRVAAALPQDAGPDTRLDVEDGRTKLKKEVAAFFKAAAGSPSPVVHAIHADVGLGKSAASRQAIAPMVVDLRARGDRGDLRNVFIAIPTHKLGDEQAEAFEKMPEFAAVGLTVRVWRGRRAPDPEHEDYTNDAIPKAEKTAMCRDLDAVAEVEKIGLPVQEHVCRSKQGECPFAGICGYQRQKEAGADVWIGAHEMLFNRKPEAMGDLAAVIVDEAAWQDGLEGVSDQPNDLALAAIDPDMEVPGDKDGTKTARWRELLRRLRAGLDTHDDGELSAGPLLEAGLDEDAAHEGTRLAWDCVVDPGIVPGMPAKERRELAAAATGNRTAIRLAGVFAKIKALHADHPLDASGWLELLHKDTDEGRIRVLRIRGRKPVREGWQVPTLIIDALLDERLVKEFWPNVRVAARLHVKTPHTRFRQIIDRDFSQSALVPDPLQDEKENQRRLRKSRELRATVLREARATDGRVLIIAQKAVREYWESLGALPPNVEFGHYNAVAGIDRWGPKMIDQESNLIDPGVRLLVLAGRILIPSTAAEDAARALTGLGMGSFAGGYLKRTVQRLLANGQTIPAETDWHPHEIAEAIRWQACEGELIQGAGRGRPANRTAANPLDVLIFSDRVMPFPVEPVSWDEMKPDWRDMMLAEGGVALECAAHAAKAYPKIRHGSDDEGITAEGMRKALQREGALDRCTPAKHGTFPYRDPLGKCPALRTTATISYLLRGQGQQPEAAEVVLSVVPDPKAWLEARLGPVKWCHLDEPVPPEPPPPPEPRPPAPPPPSGRPPDPVPPIPNRMAAALPLPLRGGAAPIMLAGIASASASACAALAAEADDAETGDTADALPFEVVEEPPPLLMRLITKRAGGKMPSLRVLEPVESVLHPFALFAAQYLAAVGPEARPDG